jgi:TATA-box binding protein (TBP) (component of TFIID and TFIIIB)
MSETVWEEDETVWDDDDVEESADSAETTSETKNEDATECQSTDGQTTLQPTTKPTSLEDTIRQNVQKRLSFYRELDEIEMKALSLLEAELGITASVASMSGQFHVGGVVDLNMLARKAPNAELDRKARPNVHIRLRHPHCSVQVNPSGFVSILGAKCRADMYVAARQIASLVRWSGSKVDARMTGFLVNNIVMSCKSPRQRRLDVVERQLQALEYHATLDEEIFPCIRVELHQPHKHSCKVFRTGALIFMGLKTVADCVFSIRAFSRVLDTLPDLQQQAATRVYGSLVARAVQEPEPGAGGAGDVPEDEDYTLEHVVDPN